MTVGQFLKTATGALAAAEVESARLDCLVLMEDTLHKDRASLLAHPEMTLTSAQLQSLNNYITQRQKHLPLAYIRGKVQFYGREFIVNKQVLVPRPESEAIIDLLKKIPLSATPHVADVGSGGGCLGITAGLELPSAKVYLYDIDPKALNIAKQNAAKYKLPSVQYKKQDLLTDCQESFEVILANLPYVPLDYPINKAAQHEPRLALYSGVDGLDHYCHFWQQITTLTHRPAHILTESLPEQHSALTELAKQAGYKLDVRQGYVLSFVAQRRA